MTQYITTSSATSDNNITNLVNNEFFYIAEGVTRISTTANALYCINGPQKIEVLGNLTGYWGMTLFDTSTEIGNFSVTIGKSGSIVGNTVGIRLSDANNTVVNDGEITGFQGQGIMSSGDNFRLTNTGTITSHDFDAVSSDGSGSDIVNYGLIQSLAGPGIAAVNFFDADTSDDVHLTNYGTISAVGGGIAVLGDVDDIDKIWNFGLLHGAVRQQGGKDFFRNGGQVVGNVDLGGGQDIFKGGGGTVEGTIHGRGGNDTIVGGISDDHMFGDNGKDVLKGGQGDDTLTGGADHDLMRGGLGLDTFDFNKTNDSAVGTQRDHILDFSKADDVIDLAGIDAKTGVAGNQAFHFIGSAAFSGTKGELRSVNSGINSKVLADVDGDKHADFSLLVEGTSNLHAGDFIL